MFDMENDCGRKTRIYDEDNCLVYAETDSLWGEKEELQSL